MTKQETDKFFNALSALLKTHVDEQTEIKSLGPTFDSMARSDVIFLIEDTWGVDLWGIKIMALNTFGELLELVKERLKQA